MDNKLKGTKVEAETNYETLTISRGDDGDLDQGGGDDEKRQTSGDVSKAEPPRLG